MTSRESQSAWRRANTFLREALRDNDEDFTSGPIKRALGLLAIPMMLEMAMESVFAVVDIAFVAQLGTDAVAAVGITEALLTILYSLAIGLGIAAATLVGQNLGAKKPDRAERSVWAAARFNAIFMAVSGLILIVFASIITGWFVDEPEALRWGTNCMRILGLGFPMYAVGMVVVQAMNGAGDTGTPATLNLICFWLLQLPLAYWLATQAGWGPNGAFTAIVVAESLLTVLAVLVFRRGQWKSLLV